MDPQNEAQVEKVRRRAIGPAGTAGRVLLGLGLIYIALSDGLAWHEALLGLFGFPALAIVGVLLWQEIAGTSTAIRATGQLGLCLATGVIFALFAVPFTGAATALFLGSTLLLAAIRGYAGCEVTAISNWLLRRDDEVGCLVFSPLDEVEARYFRGSREPRI